MPEPVEMSIGPFVEHDGAPGLCPDCGGQCAPECGLHPLGCVYGGFSAFTAYWLIADGCTLDHGEESGDA